MVAMDCLKPAHKRIQSRKARSRVVFSPKQSEMFRRMARETRRNGVPGRTGKLATSSVSVLAVFSGASGTGKTMAAEVIAQELGTNLFRINSKQVMSKYIGETEKNLARLFEMAQRKNYILFFDEADALFGKRSEIKDSHDRYANVEVSYLLAKIQAYRGLVILSTNRKANLDPKIGCRVKYLLEFSPPIPSSRLKPRS